MIFWETKAQIQNTKTEEKNAHGKNYRLLDSVKIHFLPLTSAALTGVFMSD